MHEIGCSGKTSGLADLNNQPKASNVMIHVTEKELLQSRVKVLNAIRRGMRIKENYALLDKIEAALRQKRGAGVPHIYPEWDHETNEDEIIVPDD
ncbi:MAG: hypothetical protein VXY05_01950 [Pseudomonadota bacterium]|nr:hypothetical protein [Pseudomonadota bacterium]